MRSSVQIIDRPLVSEKAFALADQGTYVFHVDRRATKIEIRRAVEERFSVSVRGVRTLTVKGRERRYGRIRGRTKDYKKAIVALEAGQKIAMFEDADAEKNEKKPEKKAKEGAK